MKKIALLLTVCMLLTLSLAGCGTPADVELPSDDIAAGDQTGEDAAGDDVVADPVTVRLAGMTGPTTMGLVGLLDNNDNGKTANHYDFTLATTADQISPLLIKGELDIAAVPVNLASVLYNKTQGGITSCRQLPWRPVSLGAWRHRNDSIRS